MDFGQLSSNNLQTNFFKHSIKLHTILKKPSHLHVFIYIHYYITILLYIYYMYYYINY